MKTKYTLILLCTVLFFSAFANAQMPGGQWFLVHQEVVKPSMVMQYEAGAHDFVAMVKANHAMMPHFNFIGMAGEDFSYTYVVPISKMADIDGVNADFAAMAGGPQGTKFADQLHHDSMAVEFTREWVVGESPELSYAPASPRLKPEDMKYFHYDFYFVTADKNAEAMGLCKEFVALFKSKNIPNGYKIYTMVMGPEMPVIIVRTAAKDAADYYTADQKDREMLGDEGKALFAKAFAITRRMDSKNSWYRPDLSSITIQEMMMMKK